MTAQTPLADPIEVSDLTVVYDRRPAVHHVSGRFEAGSLTAVVGPNGAGKSTLIKALVGLMRPADGLIVRGKLTRADIGYLPQQAEIDRSFPISVYDLVALGHWRRIGLLGAVSGPLVHQVQAALGTVGLEGFGQRSINSLSVGQFQRVLFARLLLQDARVIVLDEPFSALDARTTTDLLDLVARWHDERRTVIAVLHDHNQVREHFPQTLLLARKAICWGPTVDVLTPEALHQARTMAEAWSDEVATCTRDAA